jgi:hypothetical protein
MEHDHEIALKLHWRHTWDDKDNDFTAEADGYQGSVGRIYLHDSGGHLNGSWFWAMNAFGPEISRNIEPLSGYEPSPRKAAREVERAWFAAISGSILEVTGPVVAKNAYAAAKARE